MSIFLSDGDMQKIEAHVVEAVRSSVHEALAEMDAALPALTAKLTCAVLAEIQKRKFVITVEDKSSKEA